MQEFAFLSLGLAGLALFYGNLAFGILFVVLALPVLLFLYFPAIFAYLPGNLRRFIQRDLRAAGALIKINYRSWMASRQNLSAAEIFERTVEKHAEKAAFKYNDTEWTFRQLDGYANQVAHLFQSEGRLKKGDCVALIASSCPQYLAIWLGLNKIGCVTSLINFHLKGDALRHAITIAQCKIVIIGVDLLDNYLAIMPDLKNIQQSLVFCEGDLAKYSGGKLPCFDQAIAGMPVTKPIVADPPGYWDKLFYIYTSGTTGLPKPCIITTHRAFSYVIAHHYVMGMTSNDVLMCTLPLYHSAGGLISVGQALFMGMTVVLKKNFSASKFWDDIRKHRCTIYHYIGELCRYLLAQPPSPLDTKHSIRIIFGVGLRPQIWPEFVSRFAIPRVVECYGSTEGNVGFCNIDGRPGAIGYSSRILEYAKQQFLIRVNMESNEPIRDKNGLCILCKANEPGELIGRITTSKFSAFDGYLQKEATVKKQLTNIFQKGDLFFRTGDILVKDEEGYVFFVDRTGDTFRWKGENVSTSEVEGTISRLVGNVDVAVFGVSVPGCEGKAGMACISGTDKDLDFDQLSEAVKNNLAVYARPLFLRFQPNLEVTGTFKIMKAALKEAGFDVSKCGRDYLYYWDPAREKYQRLTTEIQQQITSGAIRY